MTITLMPGDNYRGYWIEADRGARYEDAFIRVYRTQADADADENSEKELGAVVEWDPDMKPESDGAFAAYLGGPDGGAIGSKQVGSHDQYLRTLDLLIDALITKDAGDC